MCQRRFKYLVKFGSSSKLNNWIAWRVGLGRLCYFAMDSWLGIEVQFRLSKGLLVALHQKGLFTLVDACVYDEND